MMLPDFPSEGGSKREIPNKNTFISPPEGRGNKEQTPIKRIPLLPRPSGGAAKEHTPGGIAYDGLYYRL